MSLTTTTTINRFFGYDRDKLKIKDKMRIIKFLRRYNVAKIKAKPQRPIRVLSDDEFYSTITNK